MRKLAAVLLIMLFFTMPLTVSAAGNIKETAGKFTYTNDTTTLPYRLILPENYDESKEYSLLFFFHGAGERGNDNELQFFHCVQYLADNMPETIIVAPQCPAGQQWVDTPWSNGAYSIEAVPESDEMIAVMELLDELKEKYSVDTDRIYAAGISMGGFGTWDIMMRHNDVFAAGIPVCGGGDPSQAENLVDVPLFVFHGDKDDAVPVSGSRDTVQAIKDAGVKLTVEVVGSVTGCYERCLSAMRKEPPAHVPAELNRQVRAQFSDYLSNFFAFQPYLSSDDESALADFGHYMDFYEE